MEVDFDVAVAESTPLVYRRKNSDVEAEEKNEQHDDLSFYDEFKYEMKRLYDNGTIGAAMIAGVVLKFLLFVGLGYYGYTIYSRNSGDQNDNNSNNSTNQPHNHSLVSWDQILPHFRFR